MKSATFVLALVVVYAAGNVIQTRPGETQTLECGINDGMSILKWMKGNRLLHSINLRTGLPSKGKEELSLRSRLKQERNLEISRINAQDAGEFTCSVKSQQERYRLVVASASVTPSGPLEEGSGAVLQCDVTGLTPGAAVQWMRPGGQSGRPSPLHITAVTKADAGLWECVFSAEGQTLKETVTLEVREPRPKTTSTTTTTTTTTAMKTTEAILAPCLDYDCSTAGPTPIWTSWWVWAAVGGGAMVLLLWVLILVMFNGMRRRKRRFMKMRGAVQMRPRQYCQCPGGPTVVAGPGRTKPSAPPFPAPVLSVV